MHRISLLLLLLLLGCATPRIVRSPEVMLESCESGDLEACERAGFALLTRAQPDVERARGLLGRACEGGRENACADFGMSWVSGPASGHDPARALAVLTAACPRQRLACYYRAQLEAGGIGLPANLTAAEAVLEAGCREGSDVVTGFACATLAALRAKDQPGVASSLAARGCALGNGNACALEAALKLSGGDRTAQPEVARWCQRGFQVACRALESQ